MEQERSELHAGLGGNTLNVQNSFMFSCPYLGTLEDTDTSLSYPSPANNCFRTKSPASVELSHQEAYCLTDMHPGCHVFHQTAKSSPAASKRKRVAVTNGRKQRVSLYALPLILILIFLAAILWWPAPGTAFQEAIAFGAQLQGDSEEAASVENASSAETNESTVQIDSSEAVTSSVDDQISNSNNDNQPDAALLPSTEDKANAVLINQEDAVVGSESTAETPQAAREGVPDGEVTQTDEVIESPTEIEISPEIETAVSSTESDLPQVSETSNTTSAAPTGDDASVAQERIVNDVVEETVETAEIAEAAEVVESTAAAEVEESLALVIFDLPVIGAQLPAQTTALDRPAATTPNGERLALIGPEASSPLALREAANNVRSLFVRESPNLESPLLTVLNRRQQAALLGRDSSSSWFKVRLETGVEGWINAVDSRAGVDPSTLAVLDIPPEAAATALPVSTVTAFPVIRSAIVEAGALNLRSGPGVAYEPITIINKGEIVGVLGRRGLGVWVRVRLNSGLEGWVNSSLLAPLA